jgi:hypothetical protein
MFEGSSTQMLSQQLKAAHRRLLAALSRRRRRILKKRPATPLAHIETESTSNLSRSSSKAARTPHLSAAMDQNSRGPLGEGTVENSDTGASYGYVKTSTLHSHYRD